MNICYTGNAPFLKYLQMCGLFRMFQICHLQKLASPGPPSFFVSVVHCNQPQTDS